MKRLMLRVLGFSLLTFLSVPLAHADGVLGVTGVTSEKSYAQANGNYSHGWKWVFDLTVPDNEPVLQLKFADWTAATGTVSVAGNIRFYSAQSSNAATVGSVISVTAANTYSSVMNLLPSTNSAFDLSSTTPGRQIQITVEAKIPVGSVGGSYAGSLGILTSPDTTSPVIMILGNASVLHERGTSYTDAGATAQDNIDGAIASSSVAVSGTVTVSSIGTYILSYGVSDAAGNAAAAVTRTVVVQDTVPPTGAVSYSTTTPTNQDVVATLTPSEPVTFLNTTGIATTTSGTATTSFSGNGSFVFLFADVGANTGSTTASVSNIDKTAPTITASLFNGIDGNVAVNIASTSVTVALSASESVNWLSLKIEKQDDASIVKTFQSGNDPCADWTSSCTKTWDGSLSQGTLADGVYRVRVRMKDAADTETDGYLAKTITVDTTAPVITVTGGTSVSVDAGSVYTDAGATANDARDGAVSVSSSGAVNTSALGDYTVSYTATDALGNTATTTRTVHVIPMLVSGITVSGAGGATSVAFGNTLQMSAAILPANATNQSIGWIIGCDNVSQWGCPSGEFASNFDGGASISTTGLIAPIDTGTIRVRAFANDGSGISGTITITVTN